MRYKYSICYPENPSIEYHEQILDGREMEELVSSYPWKTELEKLISLDHNDVQYNPSLDIQNVDDNHSFCLTAEGDPDSYSFSVWYNRPVKKNVMFGLLGEKEVFGVIDKNFPKDDALMLFHKFLNKEYTFIEEQMKK